MNKYMKFKYVIVTMAVCIALLLPYMCMISIASGENAETKKYKADHYEYIILEDGTAEITAYNGSATQITIPESLGNNKVSSIGDGAFDYTKIKNIIIPNYITHIGANPFKSCKDLISIKISPDHPTIAQIDDVLFSKSDKRLICYPRFVTRANYSIPEGIKIVGKHAFGYSMIRNISIPESVSEIENSAFLGCYSLEKISIPDSVNKLGSCAFWGCDHLIEVEIGSGIKRLEYRLFYDCNRLERVTIPDSVEFFDDQVFMACRSLKSVRIPNILSMGDGVFGGCFALSEINLPGTLTHIGENPFNGCVELKKLEMEENEDFALVDNVLFSKRDKRLICYLGNKPETEYQIPEGIVVIGSHAFAQAMNLQVVEMPDSIINIDKWAFWKCENLTALNVPDSVISIGECAFENCYNLTLTVIRDSYAEKYCKEYDQKYIYTDSFDWLND